MLLVAEHYFDRAADITPEFLRENGIRGLLLDIDNTLTLYHGPNLYSPREKAWLDAMKQSGIRMMLLSNNLDPGRLDAFSRLVGVPNLGNARKPLPCGARRAVRRMGLELFEVAVVGDQILTDVAAAHNAGCRAILVGYFEKEKGLFFAVKRALERPFVKLSRKNRRP